MGFYASNVYKVLFPRAMFHTSWQPTNHPIYTETTANLYDYRISVLFLLAEEWPFAWCERKNDKDEKRKAKNVQPTSIIIIIGRYGHIKPT